MSDPSDRDRVTAILGIRFALTPDEEWLARRLLEALDTIDKARELHQQAKSYREYAAPPLIVCGQCDVQWPCPTWLALNGGKECPATRPGGTFPCSWDCNEHGCQIERNGGNESGDDR